MPPSMRHTVLGKTIGALKTDHVWRRFVFSKAYLAEHPQAFSETLLAVWQQLIALFELALASSTLLLSCNAAALL